MASRNPTAREAVGGTSEAERLSERYRDRLRVLAARRLGDGTLAEDVAQETLTRVIEALSEGRVLNENALPAFVFQTARHVCQQWLRKRVRHRRAVLRYTREPRDASDQGALWRLVTAERRAEVHRTLERLSDSDRELLRLLFVDALDGPAAAARLGISPGALRVRKHRALRRLESLLGDEV